jgi:hypothetical protein
LLWCLLTPQQQRHQKMLRTVATAHPNLEI